MSIFEYNEEDTHRAIRKYEREEGRAEGKAEAVLLLLKEKGEISAELQKKVMSEKEINILNEWLQIAAKIKSVEEFEIKIRKNNCFTE